HGGYRVQGGGRHFTVDSGGHVTHGHVTVVTGRPGGQPDVYLHGGSAGTDAPRLANGDPVTGGTRLDGGDVELPGTNGSRIRYDGATGERRYETVPVTGADEVAFLRVYEHNGVRAADALDTSQNRAAGVTVTARPDGYRAVHTDGRAWLFAADGRLQVSVGRPADDTRIRTVTDYRGTTAETFGVLELNDQLGRGFLRPGDTPRLLDGEL